VTWIDRLLERLVHRGTLQQEANSKTETPADVLEALEWADTDSGEDLVERAEKVKGTPAHV
jgi:hypothetical protein